MIVYNKWERDKVLIHKNLYKCRSSNLYTGPSELFVVFRNSRVRRFISISYLVIICGFLLLSVFLQTIPGILCCQIYALAQLGQGGGNTDQEASGVGPVANLTTSKTSIPNTNETIYLNYTSSINGFQIKYPSDWIIVLPEGFEGSNNEIASNNSTHQIVAKFSSPNHDNLTVSIDSLGEQPVNVTQYIDNAVNNFRNAFAEFHVVDLRVSSAESANSTMEGNNYASNATTSSSNIQPNIHCGRTRRR